METAIFAGGCFWCLEALFQKLKGVESVESGYSGGDIKNPTYEEVCTGKTGHAEVIKIEFDPSILPYDKLLEIFFEMHDPTTLNRQGNDVGTQYRSAIFYTNEKQKELAEKMMESLAPKYSSKIVTQVKPFTAFYKAESYHQNYYNENQNQPYCSLVISPKIHKFEEKYKDLLK